MENLTQIASVPLIAAVVYALMALYKYALKCVGDSSAAAAARREKWMRLIPVFAIIAGGILGIICHYKIPSIMASENFLFALLIGMASGLAATGTNQIFKQAGKAAEDEEEETQAEINKLACLVKNLEAKLSEALGEGADDEA